MSRLSSGVTPRFGIAFVGSIDCGFCSHLVMVGTLFWNLPAMYVRLAMWSSDGPTMPRGPLTPGTLWHAVQPYWEMSCFPRSASPGMGGSRFAQEKAEGRRQKAEVAINSMTTSDFCLLPSDMFTR